MFESSPFANTANVAVACSTGGFKGVFISGVLDVFEELGFRAGAYAGASSSVLPAAAAAIGQSRRLGLKHWLQGQRIMEKPKTNMSEMILTGIAHNRQWLVAGLFGNNSPRFAIAVSAVDEAGAVETQGSGARRRGRLLLLAATRGDRSWIDDHLTPELFDSASANRRLRLTANNFDQAAYASTRMLHAWDVPAWVDARPYVDAYYTNACPALQMAEPNYNHVIALSTEPVLYRDIMQDRLMPEEWHGSSIHVISPEYDPSEYEVSYTTANSEGLAAVYEHGQERARRFIGQYGT